jgi:hypothetical protein
MYIAVAIVLAFGVWTAAVWHYATSNAVSSYQQKEAAAQDKIDAQAKTITDQAQTEITNMQASFSAGELKGRQAAQRAVTKGSQYVKNDSGLSNPACVMSDVSLQFLNSTRTDLLTAADTGPTDLTLRPTGANSSQGLRQPVPANGQGPGTVAGVPGKTSQSGSNGQISGRDLRAHPKPQPVAK